MSHDLIDTTEMYLRTIFELVEEGVVPKRARLAERLGQSGPTVSQTVARMQRDGLVDLSEGDRHLVLTDTGLQAATRVMRKHRLAECLLIDVIGLEWEAVHEEACRWEHVISEAVERRVLALLDHPTHSPYGNPIPGLAELGEVAPVETFLEDLVRLDVAAGSGAAVGSVGSTGWDAPVEVVVHRIGEPVQYETGSLALLARAGVRPGVTLLVHREGAGVVVTVAAPTTNGEPAVIVRSALSSGVASEIFVSPVPRMSPASPATPVTAAAADR